jgi:hypothetical protein
MNTIKAMAAVWALSGGTLLIGMAIISWVTAALG